MAVLAGVFAALASVFAKVAASHDGAQNVVLTLSNLTKMVSTNAHFVFATEDMVVLVSFAFTFNSLLLILIIFKCEFKP